MTSMKGKSPDVDKVWTLLNQMFAQWDRDYTVRLTTMKEFKDAVASLGDPYYTKFANTLYKMALAGERERNGVDVTPKDKWDFNEAISKFSKYLTVYKPKAKTQKSRAAKILSPDKLGPLLTRLKGDAVRIHGIATMLADVFTASGAQMEWAKAEQYLKELPVLIMEAKSRGRNIEAVDSAFGTMPEYTYAVKWLDKALTLISAYDNQQNRISRSRAIHEIGVELVAASYNLEDAIAKRRSSLEREGGQKSRAAKGGTMQKYADELHAFGDQIEQSANFLKEKQFLISEMKLQELQREAMGWSSTLQSLVNAAGAPDTYYLMLSGIMAAAASYLRDAVRVWRKSSGDAANRVKWAQVQWNYVNGALNAVRLAERSLLKGKELRADRRPGERW